MLCKLKIDFHILKYEKDKKMFSYLYSFFAKADPVQLEKEPVQQEPVQDWIELVADAMVTIEQIHRHLEVLDDLFNGSLTKETMDEIDLLCADIAGLTVHVQTKAAQAKEMVLTNQDEMLFKQHKVYELAIEMQKLSSVFRQKQMNYLQKTVSD